MVTIWKDLEEEHVIDAELSIMAMSADSLFVSEIRR